MSLCECSGQGFCPRYQRLMSVREQEICAGTWPSERPCTETKRLAYIELWTNGPKPMPIHDRSFGSCHWLGLSLREPSGRAQRVEVEL